MKESDLFEPVKEFLMHKMGCSEVYAEFGLTDVVGINGPATIAVELKKTLSFKVIEQADRNRRQYHYSYICIPEKKFVSYIVKDLLKQMNIGLLMYSVERRRVYIYLKARQNRIGALYSAKNRMANATELHKNNVGGCKSGEVVTEYMVTMQHIREMLIGCRDDAETEGWVDIATILEQCATHYYSPKSSLYGALNAPWNSEWVESTIIGRKKYYRYNNQAEAHLAYLKDANGVPMSRVFQGVCAKDAQLLHLFGLRQLEWYKHVQLSDIETTRVYDGQCIALKDGDIIATSETLIDLHDYIQDEDCVVYQITGSEYKPSLLEERRIWRNSYDKNN